MEYSYFDYFCIIFNIIYIMRNYFFSIASPFTTFLVPNDAARTECHEKTLNQTCRQYVGLTAKQFINQRILLESKRLLAYTKASVKEITWQLGFEEGTHFGKFFKKKMQKTPLAFRKEFKQS